MSTTLRFRDHAEFHRAAWQMAGAGALAGLLAHVASGGAPGAWTLAPWTLALVAAAATLGALAPALRARPGALAVRLGAVSAGGLGLALLARAGEPGAGVGVLAIALGLSLAWGMSGRRLAVGVGVGAAAALLSAHVYGSVMHARELAGLPGWAVTALAGAGFAFVSVLGLLPRHVEARRDRVAEAYAALAAQGLAGEVRELCDRGFGLWREAASSPRGADADREALADGVVRLFDVARRWSSINAEAAQAGATALVGRIEALDARIAGTSDAIARAQYAQARAALAEQLRYLADIGTSRERVLARMHNYVAAMERLHLAGVNLASTHASRDAGAARPLIADLRELGADIDSCAEALVEAERLAGPA